MSDLPDVQPYLKSICDRYQQWWQLYTLTDASEKQQPKNKPQSPFDFGLMVQTVKKERVQTVEKESREPGEEEKVERFPVLEGIRRYANNHVLLVGRPGSGKSTALARLLLKEATQQTSIPVLVELRYWRGSIEQLILDSLARHELRVEQLEMVLERLAQGATPKETLLLFDGVNELPSEKARSQLSAFRRNHPKLPMIFTTRDLSLGGDLGIEKKLEMQPLTEVQMQAFVRSYVPEQAEKMLWQLKDRLRELAKTPLLLWMLCEVIQQTPDNRLPSNLAGVFQAFTAMYEISSVRKHEVALLKGDVRPLSDRRLWKKALKALAFLMMQGETPVDFRVVIDRNEAERELSRVFPNEQFPVRDILDDLLKYHLLQNRSVDQIEFRHQLIQEYYAAEALLEQLPKLDDERLKREHLNYLKWTEPIALMLELVESGAQAVRVVKLGLEVDLMLGARLVGEVKPGFQANAMRKLANVASGKPSWLMLELLQRTGSKEAVDQLILLLDNPDRSIRGHAYLTLLTIDPGAIPEQCEFRKNSKRFAQIRESVSQSLEAEELPPLDSQIVEALVPNVRTIYDEWVSKILSPDEVITTLDPMLQSPNLQVRWSVVQVIGSLSSEASLPTLFQALEDPERSIHTYAGVFLRKLGLKSVIPRLVQIVDEHPDPGVRRNAVLTLGRIDSKEITPGILRAMRDSDIKVCCEAVKASAKIDSEEIAAGLLEVILHPDLDVRKLAADNLRILSVKENIAKFLNETHLQSLVEELENSDNWVRWRITLTLWNVASEEVIPPLQAKLNCTTFNSRLNAALVLGKFGCREAVPGLIQMMDYSNLSECPDIHEISRIAADALEQVQGDVVDKHLPGEVQDDVVTKHLPGLLTLLPAPSGENVLLAIFGIQAKCKFYNYEIYPAYLEGQKPDRQKSQNSDRSPTTINHFPNATKVKIFEQVDQYHETPPLIKDPPL